MARTKNPVNHIDLSDLSSKQLTQLSIRCLTTRKTLWAKNRVARQKAQQAKLRAREQKAKAALRAARSK